MIDSREEILAASGDVLLALDFNDDDVPEITLDTFISFERVLRPNDTQIIKVALSGLDFILGDPADPVISFNNLSGFLVDDPLVPATREGVIGSRFFWGHGTGDMVVGHHLAVAGRARLRSVDADLLERDYAMGHQISAEELADVTAWISGDATPTE